MMCLQVAHTMLGAPKLDLMPCGPDKQQRLVRPNHSLHFGSLLRALGQRPSLDRIVLLQKLPPGNPPATVLEDLRRAVLARLPRHKCAIRSVLNVDLRDLRIAKFSVNYPATFE